MNYFVVVMQQSVSIYIYIYVYICWFFGFFIWFIYMLLIYSGGEVDQGAGHLTLRITGVQGI